MKPQKQLVKHNPDKGQFGDCYRTAVAVVLGIDAKEVPHVCEKGWDNTGDLDGVKGMRQYLKERGYGISQSVFNGDLSWEGFCQWMSVLNEDIPIIVTGKSLREVNHCVVMIGGEVFCDPHTGKAEEEPFMGAAESDEGVNWWVEVITPIKPSIKYDSIKE